MNTFRHTARAGFLPRVCSPLSGLLLLAALLCGCAGYRVGPTNGQPAGSRSIQVNPFVNDTPEPRLSEAVTGALRKQIQQDGTYRLDTQGAGDIIVSGAIQRFDRGALSYEPNDVVTPRDYTLAMMVQLVAYDRITGRTNVNRQVYGRTTIRVAGDLASAERQAVPLMAADLARNAVSALADGEW